MSRTSIILVVALGVAALIVVIVGAVQIVVAQTRATAPAGLAPAPLPAGAGAPAAVALTPGPMLLRDIIRSVMPAIVSIILLIPSGVAVVSKDRPPEHQRWGTATISSIMTYWLT